MQVRIRSDYPLAVIVHCSTHRLNLVVNDLNAVVDVRNTIETVKAIINFFRESPKRRRLVPNTPLLCEIRWSVKYRSIRLFAENFIEIHKQLKHLALHDSNVNGWQNAHNLRTASETPVFIVTLHVIASIRQFWSPPPKPFSQFMWTCYVSSNTSTNFYCYLTIIEKMQKNISPRAFMHYR